MPQSYEGHLPYPRAPGEGVLCMTNCYGQSPSGKYDVPQGPERVSNLLGEWGDDDSTLKAHQRPICNMLLILFARAVITNGLAGKTLPVVVLLTLAMLMCSPHAAQPCRVSSLGLQGGVWWARWGPWQALHASGSLLCLCGLSVLEAPI